jgi:hypothetical protein
MFRSSLEPSSESSFSNLCLLGIDNSYIYTPEDGPNEDRNMLECIV